MVRICVSLVFVLLVLVAISSQSIIDNKKENGTNKLEEPILKNNRRRHRKSISTSSSELRASGSSSRAGDESLGISVEDSTSEDEDPKPNKYFPISSEERKGWRKWHRKCTPCPDDRAKKWRDPSIQWICGAYQQARRSFKSLCMMHYRNCQDGTMFVKVYDHRCANDTAALRAHGDHFFYEYKVLLTDEESEEKSADKKEHDYSVETRELVESSDSF